MITVIMRMISFQDKFYVVKRSFALIPNLLNSIHICVIKKQKKKLKRCDWTLSVCSAFIYHLIGGCEEQCVVMDVRRKHSCLS